MTEKNFSLARTLSLNSIWSNAVSGIILFADDKVLESESSENKLFQELNKNGTYSVLPVSSLTVLEKAVSSISTFKALIIDWNFERSDDEDYDVEIPGDTPFDILKSYPIYSLIYVYSQNEISDDVKNELNKKYNEKVRFTTKNNNQDTERECDRIINEITTFENENKHMRVPFVWSQTINKSVQVIFQELEKADSNWIKEIYNTAKEDGAEPNAGVINVFHNLLNESVIQDQHLRKKIKDISQYTVQNDGCTIESEKSLAKLYNQIYYTKLLSDAPLMTGDIYKFDDGKYGILFTPECDINKKKDISLDFLLFDKNQIKNKTHKKDNNGNLTSELKKVSDIIDLFNNGNMSFHILPSFPFEENMLNISAMIDFQNAFCVKSKIEYEDKRTKFKLNSPYIQQLRQRYLAYMGRIGVPAIPQSLRRFNLKGDNETTPQQEPALTQ